MPRKLTDNEKVANALRRASRLDASARYWKGRAAELEKENAWLRDQLALQKAVKDRLIKDLAAVQ